MTTNNMNFRTLNTNNLADFATNISNLLAGTEISSIDANVRKDLGDAIGTKPAELSAKTAEVAVAEAARKAAVSSRNKTRDELNVVISQVRNALRAGMASKKEYDLCGFDFPAEATTYQAQDPTDLSAFGFSNGINKLTFSGNNKASRVVYEIWRRQGDSGQWMLHAATKRQSYSDRPVTPGQYYEYKVRAVASKSVSNFSNSAVVYGVL